LYEAKTGKLHGLNASGWAPSGLTIDFLEAKGNTKMPHLGIYSATVPGCVAGWDELRKRFGTMPFSKLLAAATYYADKGFPVTEIIASGWGGPKAVEFLCAHPNSKATYLLGGKGPRTGDTRNPIWRFFRDAQAVTASTRQRGGCHRGHLKKPAAPTHIRSVRVPAWWWNPS
jgi:gamma-glutamyltranspeptidase/glutathione hydrolase